MLIFLVLKTPIVALRRINTFRTVAPHFAVHSSDRSELSRLTGAIEQQQTMTSLEGQVTELTIRKRRIHEEAKKFHQAKSALEADVAQIRQIAQTEEARKKSTQRSPRRKSGNSV